MKKLVWKSKTLWTNFLLAMLAIVWPEAQEMIKAHPAILVSMFSLLNMALRLVTKKEIAWEE